MSLMTVEWNPSNRQLRQFGVIGALVCGLLAWKLTDSLPASERSVWLGCALGGGVVVALIGWIWPRVLRWPFIALVLLTLPIGLVMSEIVVLGLFYLVVTPMGLVLRLFNRDILKRNWEPGVSSYWEPHPIAADPGRYFRQY
jgi:hypothetical protein